MSVKVESRPREGTVTVIGAAAMHSIGAREAYELGALLIDHAREVARVQLELRGGPPPAIETVPSFEPADRGAAARHAPGQHAHPAGIARRRHNQPQPRQGKANANQQAATFTAPLRTDAGDHLEPDPEHVEPSTPAGHVCP